jgi:hypothetical protein
VVEQIMDKLLARHRQDRFADTTAAIEAMAQLLVLRGRTSGERELAALVTRLSTAEVAGAEDP